jgi:general secretion pathway protein G
MDAYLKLRSMRASSRGVTLIEVMIVVVIIGLIATAVAMAVFPQQMKAKIEMTRANAATIRHAADAWRSEHRAGECPSVAELRDSKVLDRGTRLEDPWGTPFKIVCQDDETSVVSLGPDGKESSDDIIDPPMVASRE